MAGAAVEFNDLLGKEGIDPKTVLVLRHRPRERELRKVLPWLAAERPDTYNAYQQQQSPSVETAMVKADDVRSSGTKRAKHFSSHCTIGANGIR